MAPHTLRISHLTSRHPGSRSDTSFSPIDVCLKPLLRPTPGARETRTRTALHGWVPACPSPCPSWLRYPLRSLFLVPTTTTRYSRPRARDRCTCTYVLCMYTCTWYCHCRCHTLFARASGVTVSFGSRCPSLGTFRRPRPCGVAVLGWLLVGTGDICEMQTGGWDCCVYVEDRVWFGAMR